ncbi:MAG: hypothetical protein LUI04_04195, partial [Porphyromonadaceae bacterium]|nr:hypothetical protein [Porphyromonadaceae bacterium]
KENSIPFGTFFYPFIPPSFLLLPPLLKEGKGKRERLTLSYRGGSSSQTPVPEEYFFSVKIFLKGEDGPPQTPPCFIRLKFLKVIFQIGLLEFGM